MISSKVPTKNSVPVNSTVAVKKKSKPKHKKKGNKKPDTSSEAVVKIPTSKTDASTNWKLLLNKKSAEISTKKKEAAAEGPRKPQFLRRDVKRHKKQLMDNKKSVDEMDTSAEGPVDQQLAQAIQSTGNLHVTQTYRDGEKTQTSSTFAFKGKNFFPKLTGLNSLGFFDYTHYGHLKTPITPDHEFMTLPTPTVAIDCEMVGVGPMKEDALARVSIVNEFGYCLYDKFVKPKVPVVDYRTEFSGVREEDLKNAEDFNKVLQSVAELIKGRVLVGHSLKSDFDVLLLKHPQAKIRDTSFYFRRRFKKLKTPSLKALVKEYLKVEIQKGEHNSITDAQAAMKLYLIMRDDWEASWSDKFNFRLHKYWMAREYRKAFQAIGFVIQIKKKSEK